MDDSANEFFLARLEKLRLLKQTQRGEVWLAILAPDRLVVLKRIRATGLPYSLLSKRPAHPLWPEILYCAEDEAGTTVIEDYVQGEPLSARLTEKRFLSEDEAVKLLLFVADGLSALHGIGVIHRDIKPSNLILSGDGVRLIDFDAARTVKAEKQEDTALLGTKGYAPPEQFGYGQTDARSDIYALGVTAREMLGEKYHGWLCPILAKCTELDPKRRYGSAAALKRAILMRRRWAKAKIGCVILASALVGAALCFLPPPDQTPPTVNESPPAPAEISKPSPDEKEPPAVSVPETPDSTETNPEDAASESAPPAAPQEANTGEEMQPPLEEAETASEALSADEEAEAFLALFADDPEKLAYWQSRKEGYFYEIEMRRLSQKEAEEAKREAVDTMRRGELGLRAAKFEKTLPKTMTQDEKNRAYHEFVTEQIEILGITDL